MKHKSIRQIKLSKNRTLDEETQIDQIEDMSSSLDDEDIHDMAEHINMHLEKYKTIYKSQKTKEDAKKIDKHISTLDTKIQHIVKQIKDFSTMSQNNTTPNQPFPNETSQPHNPKENLKI